MKKIMIMAVITFSILNYNAALNEYESENYATAYNILLENEMPQQAFTAFGW